MIEVVTGKQKWSALVEAKIGLSSLETDQIERYLSLAKKNSVDAVITVSNEFAARPHHHPIAVSKRLTGKVSLYHFSWTSLLTSAILLQEQAAISDPEQAFLLREFIRFFSHHSVGISHFTLMPQEWTTAIERFKAGGKISRGEIGNSVVNGWHQELKDLTLFMSCIIGCEIKVNLSRAHEADLNARLKDDVDKLRKNGQLTTTLIIPDAAADLEITADLKSRTIRASMTVGAPLDKKKSTTRLKWLLRLLKAVEPENISVEIIWKSKARNDHFALAELIQHPERIGQVTHSSEVGKFKITLTTTNPNKFKGRKNFVEELKTLALQYYETIGQFLQNWTPSPPTPTHSVTVAAQTKSDIHEAGNSSSDLLEIPDFLLRQRAT